MYESLVFAKPKGYVKTTDPNKALELASQFVVTPESLKLGDLQINQDGTIKNATVRNVTQLGFENLCKILGIPRPFSRMIPIDLLFENIRELQKENESKHITLLNRSNGEVANIIKGGYSEASYMEFISHFTEREDIKYYEVGEVMSTICLAWQDKVVYGKGDKDPLLVSTFIYNSILKECSLHMFSGLYRNTCENSFIMSMFGRMRANYMLKPDLRMTRFVEGVRLYDPIIFERLQSRFPSLPERRMFEFEITTLWKKLERVVGSGEADLLFKLPEEAREVIVDNVSAWQKKNKYAKLKGEAQDEPILSDVLVYDVVNDVTSYARELHGTEKKSLEKIAGQFIEKICLN